MLAKIYSYKKQVLHIHNYKNINRDLNIKLQGLKHNLKKDQECFCKIPGSDYFLDFMNYFSIRNIVKEVHGLVDHVDGRGSWVFGIVDRSRPLFLI
jgi:hypothetical protein